MAEAIVAVVVALVGGLASVLAAVIGRRSRCDADRIELDRRLRAQDERIDRLTVLVLDPPGDRRPRRGGRRARPRGRARTAG